MENQREGGKNRLARPGVWSEKGGGATNCDMGDKARNCSKRVTRSYKLEENWAVKRLSNGKL